MNERPTVRISSQTANCIEVYINDVRIVACGLENEKDKISIWPKNAVIEVNP